MIARSALAASLASVFCATTLAQETPTPTSATSASEQVRIMARVIEDSLEQSSLDDWRPIGVGASPLEPLVRGQYIPTVGAVFTVPVAILINEPPRPEDTPVAEKGTEDLWEKNSRGAVAEMPALPNEDVFVIDDEGGTELRVHKGKKANINPAGPPNLGPNPGVKEVRELVFRKSGGPAAYDAAKVDTLRQVLLGAVAKYGHRMTRLPAEERVILIVEAPKAGLSGPPVLNNLNVKSDIVPQLPPAVKGEVADSMYTLLAKFPPAATSPKDSMMLALPQSAVTPSATAETLTTQLKELKY